MIISASKKTDIPAFYSNWFSKRLEGGYLYVENPMNPGQVSKIPLNQDTVDCFIFWIKDPGPTVEELSVLDRLEYPYCFQLTLAPYGADVEPGLSHGNELVRTFRELSAGLGPKRVIWRYDPVLLSPPYTRGYHFQWFSRLCSSLEGYIHTCIISFLDTYRKIRGRVDQIQVQAMTGEDMVSLTFFMGPEAERRGMTVRACSGTAGLSGFHMQKGKCIDDQLVAGLLGRPLDVEKDSTQRGRCGCVESVDTGTYNTCSHLCRYCYANFGPGQVEVRRRLHDPDLPLLCDRLTGEEQTTVRKMRSVVCPTSGDQVRLAFDVLEDGKPEQTALESEYRWSFDMIRKVDMVRDASIAGSVSIVRNVNIIRKKHVTIALLGAVLIVSMIPVRVLAEDRTGEGQRGRMEITAHRGDSTQAPGNTVPVFKTAVKNGADWIELDMTQTEGGVLVILHDADLMRMTGEPDEIRDISCEELSQINITSH